MERDPSPPKESRFRVLAAGLLLELCGGSVYIISLYIHQVQVAWFPNDPDSLSKVESLAFACNLGNWIPLAGFFYDWRHGGPRRTVRVACLLTLVGYGGLWYCSMHVPDGGWGAGSRIWVLRLLWFMWGHGSGYFDCACIATTAANFPKERGSAIGVAKALYGLSGALLATPYTAFFSAMGHAPSFLAFLGIGLSSLGLVTSPFVREVRFSAAMMTADAPARRLKRAFFIILMLALALATSGVLKSFKMGGEPLAYTMLVVAAGGVVVLVLAVAWGSSVSQGRVGLLATAVPEAPPAGASTTILTSTSPLAAAGATADGSLVARPINDACEAAAAASGGGDEVVRAAPPQAAGPPTSLMDGSVWQNLMTPEFWLLFFTFFAGTGGGLVLTNHIEYIVAAQFGPARHADAKQASDTLISIFSVANSLGRLGAGMGSDAASGLISRPTLFTLAVLLMGAAHAILLGARFIGLVYLATVCAGISYGSFWSLLPTMIGELYGLRAFASTYNAFTPAVSGASLILSAQLASRVAEAHTHPAPPPPPPPPGAPPPPPAPPAACYGDGCYRLTHVVICGLCVLGALTSAIVSCRTRKFYEEKHRATKDI